MYCSFQILGVKEFRLILHSQGLSLCLVIGIFGCFIFADLERHIVVDDEKLYLKEKGVINDDIQGILNLLE